MFLYKKKERTNFKKGDREKKSAIGKKMRDFFPSQNVISCAIVLLYKIACLMS